MTYILPTTLIFIKILFPRGLIGNHLSCRSQYAEWTDVYGIPVAGWSAEGIHNLNMEG